MLPQKTWGGSSFQRELPALLAWQLATTFELQTRTSVLAQWVSTSSASRGHRFGALPIRWSHKLHVPQLLSLHTAATEAREPPACGFRQEQPGHCSEEQVTAHCSQRKSAPGSKDSGAHEEMTKQTKGKPQILRAAASHTGTCLTRRPPRAGAKLFQPATSGGLLAASESGFPCHVQGVRDSDSASPGSTHL